MSAECRVTMQAYEKDGKEIAAGMSRPNLTLSNHSIFSDRVVLYIDGPGASYTLIIDDLRRALEACCAMRR